MPKVKVDWKAYRCTKCDSELELSTNHYGECYPVCKICKEQTAHKCIADIPEDGWVPKPLEDRMIRTARLLSWDFDL